MWVITPLNLAAQLVPSLKGALRPHVNRMQNEHMANVCQLVNSMYERTWCSGTVAGRKHKQKVVQSLPSSSPSSVAQLKAVRLVFHRTLPTDVLRP